MDYSPPGSSVHEIFPGKNTGVGSHFLSPGNLPDPGIETVSLVDSLPLVLPGKPINEAHLLVQMKTTK